MTLHVVQYSGGIGSWATARRVAARHGTRRLVLLFADALIEADDVYAFLHQSAAQLGVPVTRVADGRTPLQVFTDQHFLGNARIAPCSRILKQIPCRRWLDAHADPDNTIVYVGIDASRRDLPRVPAIRAGWAPWHVEFPLTAEPDLTKDAMLDEARAAGLDPPLAYVEGYGHANCAGLCIRGGQAHWARTLRLHPDRYAIYEKFEQDFRQTYGDVAFLKRTRGGLTRPYTLRQLRQDVAAGRPAFSPPRPTPPSTPSIVDSARPE
jgi:hypothetical protein